MSETGCGRKENKYTIPLSPAIFFVWDNQGIPKGGNGENKSNMEAAVKARQKPKVRRWTFRVDLLPVLTTRQLEDLLGAGKFEIVEARSGFALTILTNTPSLIKLKRRQVIIIVRHEAKLN